MRALAILPACFLALPAWSETGQSCLFSVGCEAAGGCEPVEIATEIGMGENGVLAFLTVEAGGLRAETLSAPEATARVYALSDPANGARLITIHADGTALMSRHPADPADPAITYFGTCEET